MLPKRSHAMVSFGLEHVLKTDVNVSSICNALVVTV